VLTLRHRASPNTPASLRSCRTFNILKRVSTKLSEAQGVATGSASTAGANAGIAASRDTVMGAQIGSDGFSKASSAPQIPSGCSFGGVNSKLSAAPLLLGPCEDGMTKAGASALMPAPLLLLLLAFGGGVSSSTDSGVCAPSRNDSGVCAPSDDIWPPLVLGVAGGRPLMRSARLSSTTALPDLPFGVAGGVRRVASLAAWVEKSP
jgi:hypothetical protein